MHHRSGMAVHRPGHPTVGEHLSHALARAVPHVAGRWPGNEGAGSDAKKKQQRDGTVRRASTPASRRREVTDPAPNVSPGWQGHEPRPTMPRASISASSVVGCHGEPAAVGPRMMSHVVCATMGEDDVAPRMAPDYRLLPGPRRTARTARTGRRVRDHGSPNGPHRGCCLCGTLVVVSVLRGVEPRRRPIRDGCGSRGLEGRWSVAGVRRRGRTGSRRRWRSCYTGDRRDRA